jgi:hypothetical protein
MTNHNSPEDSAQRPAPSPAAKTQSTAQPKAGSPNPDHTGGKVESTRTAEDGAAAATEEEKGGSSE